jgi:hypothetical protein
VSSDLWDKDCYGKRWEECRLRMFKNRVLGLRGRKWQDRENYIMRSLIICTSEYFVIKARRIRWEWHVGHMEKRNVYRVCGIKPKGKTVLRS